MSIIRTVEELEAIYGHPNDASTVKVADRVTPPYRILIEKSPFAALATAGPEGLDCSPRGDLPLSHPRVQPVSEVAPIRVRSAGPVRGCGSSCSDRRTCGGQALRST